MGTRGFVGFVVDDTEKIAYNHFDSYPGGLGADVLHWLWSHRHELTCDIHKGVSNGPVALARQLRVVPPASTPTAEDVERLREFANLSVGTQQVDDWYVLLRETQGRPDLMLKAGVIEDAGQFPMDSLFAEWGYVVDFDTQQFEVYEGFQHAKHDKGRFADREPYQPPHRAGKPIEYWPVALVASWPLDKLPTTPEFLAAFADEDENEDETVEG
jgi:hypothetical protein